MLPDAEQVAVAWVKQDTPLTTVLSGRVATRLPSPYVSPFLRVFQIDTTLEIAETNDIGSALLQWDAYAFSGSQPSPDYGSASLVIRTLLSSMAVIGGINLSAKGYILDFTPIAGPQRMPEEEMGWARYRIDTLMAVRPAA